MPILGEEARCVSRTQLFRSKREGQPQGGAQDSIVQAIVRLSKEQTFLEPSRVQSILGGIQRLKGQLRGRRRIGAQTTSRVDRATTQPAMAKEIKYQRPQSPANHSCQIMSESVSETYDPKR